MVRFAATEIVDFIHRTYFCVIWQMGMNDWWLIDRINPTFIALTTMAIYHCLLARKPDVFRVPPEFDPGGGAQCTSDTRNITHVVNNGWADVYCHLYADCHSSSPEVQANKIDDTHSMIRRTIHSTGIDPALVHSHNNQDSFNQNFLYYVTEELIEQPDNLFHPLSSIDAATEASMWFAAVLPMGGSAIASCNQSILCSDSNSNSNDITSITNINSIENTGLVDGCTIVEDSMSHRG